MTWLYLLAALAAAAAFHFSTAHAAWRPAWSDCRQRWRGVAWGLAVLALAAGIAALGPLAGLFSALTAFMLGAVLLPYLQAGRQLRKGKGDVG